MGAAIFWAMGAAQYADLDAAFISLAVASWFATIGQAPGDIAFSKEREKRLLQLMRDGLSKEEAEAKAMHIELVNAGKIFGQAIFANLFVGMSLFDGEAKELGQDLLKLLSVLGGGYLAHVLLIRDSKAVKRLKSKVKSKIRTCSDLFGPAPGAINFN